MGADHQHDLGNRPVPRHGRPGQLRGGQGGHRPLLTTITALEMARYGCDRERDLADRADPDDRRRRRGGGAQPGAGQIRVARALIRRIRPTPQGSSSILASAASAWLTGQVFRVHGNRVQPLRGWRAAGSTGASPAARPSRESSSPGCPRCTAPRPPGGCRTRPCTAPDLRLFRWTAGTTPRPGRQPGLAARLPAGQQLGDVSGDLGGLPRPPRSSSRRTLVAEHHQAVRAGRGDRVRGQRASSMRSMLIRLPMRSSIHIRAPQPLCSRSRATHRCISVACTPGTASRISRGGV